MSGRRGRALLVMVVLVVGLSASCSGDSARPSTESASSSDPTASDLATVKSMFAELNRAWSRSASDGYAALIAASWPPGAADERNLTCFYGQGEPNWADISVLDTAFAAQAPGWKVPDKGQPGGGQVPPGRVYQTPVHFEGQKDPGVMDVVVDGGKASIIFEGGCFVPDG